MKKLILSLSLILLLLLCKSKDYILDFGDLGEKSFRRLMEQSWARTVFDLDREEAVAVFGEEGESLFL